MKSIQVEYVKPETIETKFGPKTKYSIKGSDGTWYSCWDDCSQLKQGDLFVGVVTSRQYNGNTYYDIKRPKGIEEYILKEVKKLSDRIANLEQEKVNEMVEEQNKEHELTEEDIPF